MEIKVLGTGCPRCKEVEKRVMDVLAETGTTADVEKVTDIREFAQMGILSTPGLLINGKVKSQGRIPSKDEIKKWLEEERRA
ncbi:MAG: thioredoxin family protein [candidate division WOR-3 bacterium]